MKTKQLYISEKDDSMVSIIEKSDTPLSVLDAATQKRINESIKDFDSYVEEVGFEKAKSLMLDATCFSEVKAYINDYMEAALREKCFYIGGLNDNEIKYYYELRIEKSNPELLEA